MTAADDTDALATVTAAAAATIARGTATFTFVRQDRPSDASEELAPELGPLKEVRARRRSRWLKVLDDKARPLVSTGILDLPGSRCAMPDVKRARIIIGPTQYTGKPGTPLDQIEAKKAINLQPVWVADLLRGLSAADHPDPARVNDRECQRYSATTDMNRVANSAPHKVLMPWGGTTAYVDQARELPLTVYVDRDGFVRRVEVRSGIMSHLTLDLDTFEPMDVDWTRLPTPTPGRSDPRN